MNFPIVNINYVRDDAIALGVPCEHCDDIDATVIMNLYTRDFGACAMIAECCIDCGRHIADREGVAEVLIELPFSLREEIERELNGVAA